MFWYRLFLSLGEYDIVGTTVYEPENLPKDLLADEHHISILDEKKYVATTVGKGHPDKGCFLGMSVCHKADEDSLRKGYDEFKKEALRVKSDYTLGGNR